MPIPRKEDLPTDFEELRNVPVELPRLPDNLTSACPATMAEVLEYLSYEAPGGEHSGSDEIIDFQLEFVRAAMVVGTMYWIWRFADVEGTESYVTVAVTPQRKQIMTYEQSFGLKPEQFILVDYYDLF